jgi:hypothetical protein
MKKQTAVEWLEFMAEEIIRDSGDLGHDFPVLMGYIQEAKQNEKEQIMAAWKEGHYHHLDKEFLPKPKHKDHEDYYNKVYNQP